MSLTVQCIAGLVLGIAAGLLLPFWVPETLDSWLGVADGVIRLWTNALRLVVVPLVVAQLFVAVSTPGLGKDNAARLGVAIPAVFVGLLVFTALVAIGSAKGFLAMPFLADLTVTDRGPAAVALPQGAPADSPGSSWMDNLVPPNLITAAARPEAILGLMLFAFAFALAARRLAPGLRQGLESGFQAVRDTLFILVGWLLLLSPLLLFALGFQSASSSGLEVGRLLVSFIALDVVVLLICIAALYPLASLGGGIPPGRFARAAFPAQVTAAATRSSLATVPVLLRESETRLGIPPRFSALVIPLGGAVLKLSRVVTSPVKLLFLAHVLDITLGPGQIVVFALTILLLSPSTVGVPSVISGTRSLPAFVAAGIPPEYVILLGATTAIVDVFLTVLNSTGYLTATVLVARLGRARERPEGLESLAPEPAMSRAEAEESTPAR